MKPLEESPARIASREIFEKIYDNYNRRIYVSPDPLQFLYDYEETADREVVSIYTIRAHTRSIYAKLDVHSKKELTALVQKQVDQAG